MKALNGRPGRGDVSPVEKDVYGAKGGKRRAVWGKKGMESQKSPREGVLGPEPGTPGTLPIHLGEDGG